MKILRFFFPKNQKIKILKLEIFNFGNFEILNFKFGNFEILIFRFFDFGKFSNQNFQNNFSPWWKNIFHPIFFDDLEFSYTFDLVHSEQPAEMYRGLQRPSSVFCCCKFRTYPWVNDSPTCTISPWIGKETHWKPIEKSSKFPKISNFFNFRWL